MEFLYFSLNKKKIRISTEIIYKHLKRFIWLQLQWKTCFSLKHSPDLLKYLVKYLRILNFIAFIKI